MTASPHLSAIVIARNEAARLPGCLASLSFVDEIVVVDGGSDDDTVAIARAAGARVEIRPDWPGFGPQKNIALSLARGRWVLSLDADERVPPALAEEIRAAIAAPGQTLGWRLPRRTRFLGRWIRHCGWTPDHVLRLFQRDAGRFSDDLVHERVIVSPARIGTLRTPIDHDSYPTLSSWWRKTEQFADLWAEQQFARGRRVSVPHAVASAFGTFVRTYVLRRGFLDGATGLVLCLLLSQGAFLKYLSLIERHRLAGTARTERQPS